MIAAGYNGLMFLLWLVVLAVELFALVDAAIRPDRAFRAADKRSKTFWLAVLGGAILLGFVPMVGFIAVVASIVYLVDVRPRVRALKGRGGSASGPYGPW